ncbi:ferredoxin [Streptomyces monticola]|uniref:Ferredoxin n=1 Tax=Streptomyces monticola TaxID=2666263 RepID=A0ABW2JNU4_9ACTN
MKIVVDRDRCTGIGICESLVPDVFEVNEDGEMVLLVDAVPEGMEAEAREAVASCPNEALALED